MYNIFKVFSQDRSNKIMNLEDKILIINHHLIDLEHPAEVTLLLMTIDFPVCTYPYTIRRNFLTT